MTEIAHVSGASIGCVYQYFPDKESVARALHSWYGEQMEQQLAPIIGGRPASCQQRIWPGDWWP